ncbi:hypothetical protein FB451DRAFT_1016828 [Mycena latifolia]|nr:hypothetical protein FB451DRAFT_1016828 [Mycena latifolia]
MPVPTPLRRTHFLPAPSLVRPEGLEVLKSTPRGALQRIAYHRTRAAPPSFHSASDADRDGARNDGEEVLNGDKKHICPTCAKRFNRPSSLRTHVNTHTGVTRVLHVPACGRAFNVNSNMRRHFRTHASPPRPPASAWSASSPSLASSGSFPPSSTVSTFGNACHYGEDGRTAAYYGNDMR